MWFIYYIQDAGVKLLHLRAVSPDKYALTLMDAVFDDNEMAQCCFIQSNRSTKPPLERAKTKLIEGMVTSILFIL